MTHYVRVKERGKREANSLRKFMAARYAEATQEEKDR
jgi:hypothetical protein